LSGAIGTLTREAIDAAYGWKRGKDWNEAVRLLGEAARAGEADAERQYQLITQMDVDTLLSPPVLEPQSTRIKVGICRGFAPPGFSEWLIDKAASRLSAATAKGSEDSEVRTARSAAFGPRDRDLIVAVLQERAARLTGVPVEFHEPPNALSYEAGQQFKQHVDYIDPRVPEFRTELEYLGQRTITFVTYLNEDFDGAETEFLRADLKLRGRTGDSIVFLNVLPNGQPDYDTVHCAPPPTRGRKWVLSQWIRNKPFLFRPEDLP
jgi:predicted 2-oxoglutarate/Fe(II)-dependent dioxygenase YbiX